MTTPHGPRAGAADDVAGRGGAAASLRAAARIARADLLGRPVQTGLTALAIFAAATALVVTLALRAGLDDPFAAAQQATRGSHVSAYGEGDLSDLATLPGVVVADARPVAQESVTLGGTPVVVGLERLPAADAPVDRPQVTDGRRPTGPGEVLVERSFARETGLRVGDTLAGRRVTGLAVTTERATYPRWRPGVAWAPDVAGPTTRVAVRLSDPEATDAFKRAALAKHADLRFSDWHEVRDTITDQARTNTIIIGVNTLLALIAVGFTVATVISGRVLAQRREIGLLKAIGITPRGVVSLLVAEYAAVALAAGLLGLVAGTAIAPLLLEPMSNLLATPTPSAFQPSTLIAALVLIVAAVALFAALPATRAGRLNTVDALALGRAHLSGGASRAARIAAALRLPATARLGVKDAFTSPARAALTTGALTMMVVTLVAALSMEATYDRVIEDPALRAKPWDIRIEGDQLARVQNEPGIERATTIAGLQVSTKAGELQARAVGDGFAEFPYAVPDGRMFAKPGEAIAGRGFLDKLGLHVGDRVTVTVEGRPVRLTLVGRHVEPDNHGEVVIFPAATLTKPPTGDVIADLEPGTDGTALANTFRRSGLDAELVSAEVRQERADVRPIVYGSSALLVAVGLVNLLTTLLLVTRERARDFGILKALGLTPRGVLTVVNAGGAALGAIAIVIGIPAGIVIFRALMSAMSPSEGADIVGTPGPLALLLILPAVALVTALASSLPARNAGRASAATVLRAE
ncbi:ABC transporter permease [Solirubrobacter soli]|uniref:ABC transporter permease n=1 Tax=Solirubrobacter soli TaxID=363832 RepID=UPI0004155FF7|nr:ABC transporter permease [Solirubrobacter soli]